MEDFRNTEVINFREALRPVIPIKVEPKIDEAVSKIVGKPIRVNNPNLIKLVAKYKKLKGDSEAPDNFLSNPEFIKELKTL